MTTFRSKPVQISAIQWTGDNIDTIWDHFGPTGIYGPTEKNPDWLLLTTIDDEQVPCPRGHWVIAEPVANRFYPCAPEVFAKRWEPADASPISAPHPVPETTLTVADSPKMLHETLCTAQVQVAHSGLPRAREHVLRLERLINECERHRPLGPDGKHGDRHTATCGCEDR